VVLFRCTACGFVSGRPAQEEAPEERYRSYHAAEAPPAPAARYARWLARAEARVGRGRLLEVGAGTGGFVEAALARGWSVDATEVSASGLERLRRTGARVFEGPLEAAAYPGGAFDLLVSLEVLEHLPEPLLHLREARRVLRRGGALLLTTPNFDGLSRRALGLGWRVVHPEHLGYFTSRTLDAALRLAGLAEARVRARSLDVTAWRRGGGEEGVPAFDPLASARLRDAVEAAWPLRAARAAVNGLLGLTGLGDSLLAWARA
jgi:SAM-dependent methyltransferase